MVGRRNFEAIGTPGPPTLMDGRAPEAVSGGMVFDHLCMSMSVWGVWLGVCPASASVVLVDAKRHAAQAISPGNMFDHLDKHSHWQACSG